MVAGNGRYVPVFTGMKPLYYLICPKGIVFASQYDQLLKHPWRGDLGVSREALGLYLRLAYIPAPSALLRETHMLEPGTWEVISNGVQNYLLS